MQSDKPYTITIPLEPQINETLSYTISKNNNIDPNTFIYSPNIFDNTVVFNELLNTTEIEKMGEEYPALKKAYKNFRQIYDLVKNDYLKKGYKKK
tara:strand:+ start:772 stop:1056 length:285 start_codon:yes stop_codon:yes gene_type:complete